MIKREHYLMLTAETMMPEMSEAKYFSKINALNGYWQIKVDEGSSELSTFNIPSGFHGFKRGTLRNSRSAKPGPEKRCSGQGLTVK